MNRIARMAALAAWGTTLLGGAFAQSLDELSFRAPYVNDYRRGYSRELGTYRADWYARQVQGRNQQIEASVCAAEATPLRGRVVRLGEGPLGPPCEVPVYAPLPQSAARLRWTLLRPHRVVPGRLEAVQTVTKDLPIVRGRPHGRPDQLLYCELPQPVRAAGGEHCSAVLNVPPRPAAGPAPAAAVEAVTVRIDTLNGAGAVLQTRSLTRRLPTYVPIVASLGDSAASGEGNPDVAGRAKNDNWDPDLGITPGSKDCEDDTAVMMFHDTKPDMAKQPVWLEPRAHRSLKSAPALAVRRLLDEWPYVTFLSLAKSGARILDASGGNDIVDQLRRLKAVVGNRPVDALVISIGLNDMHFTSTLEAMVKGWVRAGNPRQRFQQELDRTLRDQGFPRLKQYLDEIGIDAKAVFLTGYPAALFDSKRACGVFDNLGFLVVSKSESELITDFGERLNVALADAARRYGWHFVDGIDAAFRSHGYCSSTTYFRSATESCRMQGDFDGTVHPNERGTRVIANAIAREVRPLLPPAFPADPGVGD